VDIFGSANEEVRLYVSTNILSIRTIQINYLCGTPPPAGFEWVNQGVKVELYTAPNAGGPLVGTVYYGHLVGRIDNGVYDTPNGKRIGYLGPEDCINPDGTRCDCYQGIHVHMERSSGNNGYTYYRDCTTPVDPSMEIYKWTISNGWIINVFLAHFEWSCFP